MTVRDKISALRSIHSVRNGRRESADRPPSYGSDPSVPLFQPPLPSHPPPGLAPEDAVLRRVSPESKPWDKSSPGRPDHRDKRRPPPTDIRTSSVVLGEVEKACRQLDSAKDGRVPIRELRAALNVISAREDRDARARKIVGGRIMKPRTATSYALDHEKCSEAQQRLVRVIDELPVDRCGEVDYRDALSLLRRNDIKHAVAAPRHAHPANGFAMLPAQTSKLRDEAAERQHFEHHYQQAATTGNGRQPFGDDFSARPRVATTMARVIASTSHRSSNNRRAPFSPGKKYGSVGFAWQGNHAGEHPDGVRSAWRVFSRRLHAHGGEQRLGACLRALDCDKDGCVTHATLFDSALNSQFGIKLSPHDRAAIVAVLDADRTGLVEIKRVVESLGAVQASDAKESMSNSVAEGISSHLSSSGSVTSPTSSARAANAVELFGSEKFALSTPSSRVSGRNNIHPAVPEATNAPAPKPPQTAAALAAHAATLDARERRIEHSALVKLRHATRSRPGFQRMLDACRRFDADNTGRIAPREFAAVLTQLASRGDGVEAQISSAEVERLLTWNGHDAHGHGEGTVCSAGTNGSSTKAQKLNYAELLENVRGLRLREDTAPEDLVHGLPGIGIYETLRNAGEAAHPGAKGSWAEGSRNRSPGSTRGVAAGGGAGRSKDFAASSGKRTRFACYSPGEQALNAPAGHRTNAFLDGGLEGHPEHRSTDHFSDRPSLTPAQRDKKQLLHRVVSRIRERAVEVGTSDSLTRLFLSFDTNRNGHITYGEFGKALSALGVDLGSEEMQRVGSLFDRSRSGDIQYADFSAVMESEWESYVPSRKPHDTDSFGLYQREGGGNNVDGVAVTSYERDLGTLRYTHGQLTGPPSSPRKAGRKLFYVAPESTAPSTPTSRHKKPTRAEDGSVLQLPPKRQNRADGAPRPDHVSQLLNSTQQKHRSPQTRNKRYYHSQRGTEGSFYNGWVVGNTPSSEMTTTSSRQMSGQPGTTLDVRSDNGRPLRRNSTSRTRQAVVGAGLKRAPLPPTQDSMATQAAFPPPPQEPQSLSHETKCLRLAAGAPPAARHNPR